MKIRTKGGIKVFGVYETLFVIVAVAGVLLVGFLVYWGIEHCDPLFPELETITIGDPSGTVITRTQIEDCPYIDPLSCIDKEVYTGTIVGVHPDKIIFEDGFVLMASRIDDFGYKIGSDHIIEIGITMSEFGGGWRVVKGVTILN